MPNLHSLAQRVRHAPGLDRLDQLWDVLRGPYHRLIGLRGGALVRLGGHEDVRMPAVYTGADWDRFEPETVLAVADWARAHPTGAMLDVGCSLGVFSLLVLTLSSESRVIAFDSDVASVKVTRRMCGPLGAGRLDLVQGFVSNTSTSGGDLAAAVAATSRAIKSGAVGDDVNATRYRTFHDDRETVAAIPMRTLDQLGLPDALRGRPVLLKCDVEGAELYVLRGAREVLRTLAPTLALSVHPAMLARLGHSVEAVRALLEESGYGIDVIAVDHEHHWWCEPKSPSRPSGPPA